MNSEWRTYLTTRGGRADEHGIRDFGDAAAERKAAADGDVLVDLSHLALLRIHGADADAFLQGQFSNDIRQLVPEKSQFSSYSTPKGRMLAVFRLIRTDNGILLQLPAELSAAVAQRLKMFVLRSKVVIEAADELAALGVSGPSAPTILAERFGGVPASAGDCSRPGDVIVMSLAGPQPRYQIIGPVKSVIGSWEAIVPRARRCGYPVWRWLDIEAGVPSVWTTTSELFVPQNVNLELLGGVNFKKGCYPGQEIIARMQYLGKLKQRMVRGHLDGEREAKPGDPVYTPAYGDQAAGSVVDAQPSPGGGHDLLVVAPIGAQEIRLREPAGPGLQLSPPPYPLTAPAEPSATGGKH